MEVLRVLKDTIRDLAHTDKMGLERVAESSVLVLVLRRDGVLIYVGTDWRACSKQ